ncbi:UDP-N-acetylmuramoyl-tripeptide--D-alanyl-D-alanine ligase [Granulosicoccus antarcticus]|uniref:UDP-N-acetylmuramoyl-tripeptide--D-alanyl-D-alanine ligase n=1 Tax=Granulosicoccus antarcticus IMCC3135 TaxID=1192854 RepID=A0A2Z2P0P1_9GAMM|nr:UDP-N-acetylmuramoyl-tripeptide--D-alanyl-D-alanine ligase [Granulosicoccus antarcticus]ASJ75891.1 UDP-N-acetylmuramoyl-tripeptide--D-alanyl-D-alanine ligase [Granulosicoccus antarcticus IMCC3135]
MSFLLTVGECVHPLQATLLAATTGESQAAPADVEFTGVSIDTRTLKAGDLYIAIQGTRFNGHEFISAAIKAGAAAVLVHEDVQTSVPQLRVVNTQVALGQLARYWAQAFEIPLVAVTGSNGKTTVKEIIATILRQIGPVLATHGNLNNEIGVPLTLLEMREEHDYAVIEMGANHAGEIARLVNIAQPDVAVITKIGEAHLEGFGSIEGIANAKSEIYAGLSEHGYAVINADDQFADQMFKAASHCHVRDFGQNPGADVQGVPGAGLKIKTMGQVIAPHFQLSGEHNQMNALAAVAAVQCLDVQMDSIILGLENVRAVPGRLEKKPGLNGAKLIDDSYNANPDSARQAVDVLARYEGTRHLVLGDMAELGVDAEALHTKLGEYARQCGVDELWTVGPLSSFAQKAFNDKSAAEVHHFTDQEELIAAIKDQMTADMTVLVKGSRSARMERVVKALMLPTRSSSTTVGEVSA